MNKNKIGIIGAMKAEVETLIADMEESFCLEKASMFFHSGRIGSTDVVVVQCGVGKVDAGICVQILCDCFDVTHVLNTGVAGSLDNRINIGDIVVSADAMYHDVDATVFGYEPGEVPQLGIRFFTADAQLRAEAVRACREAAPEIGVFEGRIVSGDQFIASREKKEEIREKFGGLCTEMEGAAIAQAAYLNKVPFVVIRAISDKADESVEVSYAEFEAKAAMHCARVVEHMIRNLA